MEPFTFEEHKECARAIHTIEKLRSRYIDDYHNKKAIFKRSKFTMKSSELNEFYRKYLFLGRKSLGSFGVFPCHFQGGMDGVVFEDFRGEYDSDTLLGLYYSGYKHPVEPVDVFSNDPCVTESDREVVYKLNADMVTIMRTCCAQIRHHFPRRDIREMEKYIAHVQTLTCK